MFPTGIALNFVVFWIVAPYIVVVGYLCFSKDSKDKGKLIPVLFLTKHHAMKAYWGGGGWTCSSTHSLTSALDGGEWSASQPGRFTPRGKRPGTHCIGSWVGPRAIHVSRSTVLPQSSGLKFCTLTLKMETARSSETLVSNHSTT
jgi:hypothetical protein